MNPYQRPCLVCGRLTDVGCSVYEEMQTFHHSCWLAWTGRRLAHLEKKKRNGSITLEEAEEAGEKYLLFQKMLKEDEGTPLSDVMSSKKDTLLLPRRDGEKRIRASVCERYGLPSPKAKIRLKIKEK